MRRRHQLRPDTFPFLAVLLCTMGSLILVLMVFDRRARLSAVARAEAEWQQSEHAEAEAIARLQAQEEQRQQAQHQQARARLTGEAHRLTAEQERVRAELESVLRSLRSAEQDETGTAKLRTAGERAAQARQGLRLHQTELVHAERAADGLREESKHLTEELLALEQGLARLREQRQREQQTWSVVPYIGRRGQNVRPHYVECTANGLIFHPDRLALTGSTLTPGAVLEQVKWRTEKVPAGAARPYWLLLVRPDGISQYYLFLNAVKSLDVAYGYEFVDADWVLDFPDPGTAPLPLPPATALRSPRGPRRVGVPGPVAVGTRYHPLPHPVGPVVAASLGGFAGVGGNGGNLPGGSGSGGSVVGVSAPGGAREGLIPRSSLGASGSGDSVPESFAPGGPSGGGQPQGGAFRGQPTEGSMGGASVTSAPPSTGFQGDGSGTAAVPGGRGGRAGNGPPDERSEGGGAAAEILPPQAAPPQPADGAPQLPPLFPAPGSGGTGGSRNDFQAERPNEGTRASPGQRAELPPAVPEGPQQGGPGSFMPRDPAAAAGQGSPAGAAGAGGAAGGAAATGGAQGAPIGSQPASGRAAGPPGRPGNIGEPSQGGSMMRAPLRPASRFGSGECIIIVDCTALGVRVSPSRLSISLEELAPNRGGAAELAAKVRNLIERRRAAHDPEGGPFLPTIRLVIHPDGLRAFHLAHPALDGLPVPKRTVLKDE